jgi:hypothetical protein
MNLNTNLLARLMLAQLPGLVGAMQLAAAAPPSLSELARRQRKQNMTNALLSTGLLTPNPKRYPPVPPQRTGAGLSAVPQSRNDGAGQRQVIEALGMGGHGVQSRGIAIAGPRLGGQAPAQARHKLAPEPAEPAKGSSHQGASRVPKLREFTGTLANRLNYPPVLPGGWKLYGYERHTGNPVYIGPGRQLCVYV